MTEKRSALIIASYQYEDADLRQLVAPAQDAEALASVLADPVIGGFEVQTLLNEPSYKVNPAIEAFFADRKRDDLLLLYFSGHGIKDEEGRLYLTTSDTRRKMLRTTAIPATLVNDVMRYSRSRRQVLLLDCCYSGAFARGLVVRADQDMGTGEYFKEARGQVVLTASDALQYSFEGDQIKGEGTRSVFTHTLVRGLETGEADLDGDGYISFDELYDYVYERVIDEVPQQKPRKWVFDVEGEIVIARNPHPVVKPAELPSELQQSIEDLRPWVREGAARQLGRLLRSSNKSVALAAHTALTRMADDDSQQVRAVVAKILEAHAEAQRAVESKRREEQILAEKAERIPAEKAKPEPLAREPTLLKKRAWSWPLLGLLVLVLLIGVAVVGLFVSGLISVGEESALIPTTPVPVVAEGPTPTHTRRPTTATSASAPVVVDTPSPTPSPTTTSLPTAAQTLASTATPKPQPPTPTSMLGIGSTLVREKDGMEMVYVPAGTFQMGSDESDPNAGEDEKPLHDVTLDAFWIDRTELTNAKYVRCVVADVCQGSAYADDFNFNQADYPVIGVSWTDARDYCQWVGGRLPTEAEWEYAARGPDAPIYPWGNTFDSSKVNAAGNDTYEHSAPVGTFPTGASWIGAEDMAGNVWEWVNDWYDRDYYVSSPSENPTGSTGNSKVLRGGYWESAEPYVRAAYRSKSLMMLRSVSFGFRCVVDPG